VQLRTGNLPTRKIASNPPENGRAQRLRGIKCCMDAPNHMVNGFYATTQWPKTVINPSLDVIGSDPAVDHDPCFSPVDLSVDGRYFTRAERPDTGLIRRKRYARWFGRPFGEKRGSTRAVAICIGALHGVEMVLVEAQVSGRFYRPITASQYLSLHIRKILERRSKFEYNIFLTVISWWFPKMEVQRMTSEK
jgi:hypothetical protein